MPAPGTGNDFATGTVQVTSRPQSQASRSRAQPAHHPPHQHQHFGSQHDTRRRDAPTIHGTPPPKRPIGVETQKHKRHSQRASVADDRYPRDGNVAPCTGNRDIAFVAVTKPVVAHVSEPVLAAAECTYLDDGEPCSTVRRHAGTGVRKPCAGGPGSKGVRVRRKGAATPHLLYTRPATHTHPQPTSIIRNV